MTLYNSHLLLRVEGKCDAVVQKVTDNVINYLAGRLSTQKKNDFTPKNDELAFSRINTDPCLAIVDALEKVEQTARTGLGPGKNCEQFLTEIGVAFHGLLLDHLRKFTISAAGGIMLTKDLAMYQDAVAAFGIPVLSDRFEMLRQLGNLFIVQPAVLRSYMREAHLAKIEDRLIRPYLLKRADYATHVRDMNDEATPVTPLSATTTNASLSSADTLTGVTNGVSTAAITLNGIGLSDVEKIRRLTGIMAELQRWTNENDRTRINDANLQKSSDANDKSPPKSAPVVTTSA